METSRGNELLEIYGALDQETEALIAGANQAAKNTGTQEACPAGTVAPTNVNKKMAALLRAIADLIDNK